MPIILFTHYHLHHEMIAMLPRVILFNAVSLDGRIDGFTPDLGQFYDLAATWKEDATLAGAQTILKACQNAPPEDEKAFLPPEKDLNERRPLLVIPDSRGRVRCWHFLKTWPYWSSFVSLCSRSTPEEHLDYLRKRHIDCIIAGEDHVDFKEALEELNSRYGIKVVRVDSGGILNGVLLRQGLIDEVSVLIYPSLVGGTTQSSIFRAPDLESPEGAIPLRLIYLESLEGGAIWLRYDIIK